MTPISSVPGIVLPAIPSAYGGILSHLLWQLGASARMPADQVRRLQFAQLEALLRHAYDRSPFWHRRLAAAGWSPQQGVDQSLLERLPVLTRADVQNHFADLRARPVPEGFGAISVVETSGSTGRAVKVEICRAQILLYDAIALRCHQWHRRDFTKKLANLRHEARLQATGKWLGPVSALYHTGPAVVLDGGSASLADQLDWLVAEQPHYLLVSGGRLNALAELALERGQRIESLEKIMTYATVMTPELRALVRQAFGVEIDDGYSTREVGHVAYQCPRHEWYHVHAEAVIVEVVGDDGFPVPVGEPGHVLATVLHSFAMPLIRYQVGDMAVAGRPCDCGRTLPVIERILGRQAAVIRLPDGRKHRVVLLARDFLQYASIRDFRVVMYADDVADVFLTAEETIDETTKESIRAMVERKLGHPFPIEVKQVAEIDWGRSWKREPFLRLDRRRE